MDFTQKELVISNQKITFEDKKPKGKFLVEKIVLSNCGIDNESMKNLAYILMKCQNLKYIDLRDNDFTIIPHNFLMRNEKLEIFMFDNEKIKHNPNYGHRILFKNCQEMNFGDFKKIKNQYFWKNKNVDIQKFWDEFEYRRNYIIDFKNFQTQIHHIDYDFEYLKIDLVRENLYITLHNQNPPQILDLSKVKFDNAKNICIYYSDYKIHNLKFIPHKIGKQFL